MGVIPDDDRSRSPALLSSQAFGAFLPLWATGAGTKRQGSTLPLVRGFKNRWLKIEKTFACFTQISLTGLTFNYIDTVYFTRKSSISGPWMNLWCAPNHTSPQSSMFGKLTLCYCCYSALVPGRKENAQCVQNQKANQR